MSKAERESQSQPETNPLVFVLSGPSGVGKDAVLNRMKKAGYPLYYVITATTRPKRPRETDGTDYRFVSTEEFDRMRETDGLLEYARVYDNWYGVPKDGVKAALERGQDVMIKVDIQGAASIKKLVPQAVTIFLAPPSIEELGQRLSKRRTESPEAFQLRLDTARHEMEQRENFDYSVVNRLNRIDEAVRDVTGIIESEKAKGGRGEIRL